METDSLKVPCSIVVFVMGYSKVNEMITEKYACNGFGFEMISHTLEHKLN